VLGVPPDDVEGPAPSKAPKALLAIEAEAKHGVVEGLREPSLREIVLGRLRQATYFLTVVPLMPVVATTKALCLNLSPRQARHLADEVDKSGCLRLVGLELPGFFRRPVGIPKAEVRILLLGGSWARLCLGLFRGSIRCSPHLHLRLASQGLGGFERRPINGIDRLSLNICVEPRVVVLHIDRGDCPG
jgi:hypothetical protein